MSDDKDDPSQPGLATAATQARQGEGIKWLAGSIVVGAGLLTLAGVTGANLSRLVQIHPGLFLVGTIAILAACALGVSCYFIRSEASTDGSGKVVRRALGALACFVVGLSILLFSHARVSGEQQRPGLTMGLVADDKGQHVTIKVSAAHLRSDQYVFVLVQGQNSETFLDLESAEFDTTATIHPNDRRRPDEGIQYSKQRIYKGRIGSSPFGDVDAQFDVAIADGLYEQVVAYALITSAETQHSGWLDNLPLITSERSEQSKGKTRELEVELGKEDENGSMTFACTAETLDVSCTTVIVPTPPPGD